MFLSSFKISLARTIKIQQFEIMEIIFFCRRTFTAGILKNWLHLHDLISDRIVNYDIIIDICLWPELNSSATQTEQSIVFKLLNKISTVMRKLNVF